MDEERLREIERKSVTRRIPRSDGPADYEITIDAEGDDVPILCAEVRRLQRELTAAREMLKAGCGDPR